MAYPSLTNRILIAKVIGFLFGLIGFIALPYFNPEAGWLMRWGVLLWYTTVGAVIGMAGIFTRHPILMLPTPWWIRAPIIGAWMNFVLTFFAYEEMEVIMVALFGHGGAATSPFWFVAEGAVIGLVIGFCATQFGGEGPETVDI